MFLPSNRSVCLFLCCWLLAGIAARADTPAQTPGKWDADLKRFEEQDRQHPPEPGQVLFVGSSSIRLWNLPESFPELATINRGFGGSEIQDSVDAFSRIVVPPRPRLIVLYAGDNDLASGKHPVDVYRAFQRFVEQAHTQLPGVPVVYVSIKPSLNRWNLIHRIRAANALIEAECAEDPLLTFVDVEPAMLGPGGQPKASLFVDDGLHLSKEGYQTWSDLLRPLLVPR